MPNSLIPETTINESESTLPTESFPRVPSFLQIAAAEREILRHIACGTPLSETLDALINRWESFASPSYRVAILPIERDNESNIPPLLRFGSAPHMPPTYREDVDGTRLLPENSPSADVVLNHRRTLIEDGETDPRCRPEIRAVYRRNQIRSCWIEPMTDPNGTVQGVFCVYSPQPGLPTAEEIYWMEQGASLAAIAVARAHSDEILQKSEAAMRHILAGAKCLLWYATIIANDHPDYPFHWKDIRVSNLKAAQEFLPVDTTPFEGSYIPAWRSTITPEEIRQMDQTANRALFEDRSGYRQEFRCRDRYGNQHWLHEDVRLEKVEAGLWQAIGVCIDVTDRKEAELAREALLVELSSSREQYHNLFQHIPTGVYRTTPEGRFLLANPAIATMLGYETTEALLTATNLQGSGNRADFKRRLEEEGQLRGYEAMWRRQDGGLVCLRESTRVVRNDDGTVRFYEGTVEDITEIRRTEAQMRRQATHDALTGLPNRTQFAQTLSQTLLTTQAFGKDEELGGTPVTGTRPAVLFIDLDRFKQVNDTQGHAAGDKLLQEMARRFLHCLRGGETVARLGGDEFVVLLPSADSNSAIRTARRIRRAAAKPALISGQEAFVSASIGIALYDADSHDADTLLKNADTAMYYAKESGGDGVALFTPAMGNAIRERATVEAELRRAIRQDELILFYQPQFDLITGRMIGAEALVRWRHKQRGLVPPGEFIAVAEESGLIEPLGEWVLQEACRQGAHWLSIGRPLRVSVNLSARQFNPRNRLTEQIERVLRETNFPAYLLDLEITESVLLTHNAPVPETLASLKRLGVRLLLDDFGTGYGSLLYLRQFPLDVLKVDRSFVGGLSASTEDFAIVRAVIDLAHALGISVIAEGVETNEQRSQLVMLGCDAMQGYLLAAPLQAEEITTRLIRGDSDALEVSQASEFDA